MARSNQQCYLLLALVLWQNCRGALGFSSPLGGDGASSPSAYSTLFDRFQTQCPADPSCIAQFDPNLIDSLSNDSQAIWAAVFRSNNNQPSVFVKDEFLQAMRLAVDTAATSTTSTATMPSSDLAAPNDMIQTPLSAQTPVAVARLHPSEDYEGCWVMDSLRCVLKKEETDPNCDGGSEHTEAVASAIDSLLLQYLSPSSLREQEKIRFEGAIRTKGTLVAGTLLEERGFVPIETLQRDMATHTSSLDLSIEKYAERSISAQSSPGNRDRALAILSCLGRIDRDADIKASQESADSDTETDEYDPWATIRSQL